MQNTVLRLSPEQKVILLVGPSGAGKGTLANLIASSENWAQVSEDNVWDDIGHPPTELRTPQGFAIVKQEAVRRIEELLRSGKSVVFEFLVFDNPPTPIFEYQEALTARSIPFDTRVLVPSVEKLLANQQERGRPREIQDLVRQRKGAEHEIACLTNESVPEEWRIDSTELSPQETFDLHFKSLVVED